MAGVDSYREIYPLIARTAAPTTATYDDGVHTRKGGHFVIDVTAVGAAPSVVFNIEALDKLSGKWYPILISAAITATGTTVLKVYPGAPPANNAVANDILPPS